MSSSRCSAVHRAGRAARSRWPVARVRRAPVIPAGGEAQALRRAARPGRWAVRGLPRGRARGPRAPRAVGARRRLIESAGPVDRHDLVLVAVVGLVVRVRWPTRSAGFIVPVILVLLGLVGVQWARFTRFQLPGGRRRRTGCGCTTGCSRPTAQTVPPGRVQAVPGSPSRRLWRGKDLVAVEVNVAATAGSGRRRRAGGLGQPAAAVGTGARRWRCRRRPARPWRGRRGRARWPGRAA